MDNRFDLFIIGAGPGGYVAAIRAAKAGLKVAVAENRRAGGTCLNRGCIPAKAMIHASSLYREACEGARFGVHASDVSYDYGEILTYRNDVVDTLVGGVEQLLSANGVTVLNGTATLQKPDGDELTVTVGEETYAARDVILASGSQPAKLPVPGADLDGVVTSDGFFAMDEAPESIVIIGGGVIGVEFATVLTNLGTKVTIVEALPKLLDNFDKEISQNLKMILKKRGADIHTDSLVKGFAKSEDGISVTFEEKGKEKEVSAACVLMAAGRTPVTEGLFGEGVTPEMNRKFVKVDDNFMTSIPHVYAIGDLAGGMQLAHAASAQGVRVAEHLAGETFSQDLDIIPGCVYTDPEIASAGMTEAKAKDAGIETVTGKFIMTANGKSLITKDERGFIKVVANAETDEILGAQMMCSRATDMIGEFVTAIANHMTVSDMLRSVRSHPTYNEGIGEALESVHGESLHTVPRRRR